MTGARVIAVACGAGHGFSKPCQAAITLVAGMGVAGDAHAGVTVRHRSRLASTPDAPNLRQVHLLHAELFDELEPQGFVLAPGDIGENLLTRGINLLGLPSATRLQIGADAEVEITGLRNPCHQLDRFRPGLMAATLARGVDGSLVRKAGVMAIVITGGVVHPDDPIRVALPPQPYQPLRPV